MQCMHVYQSTNHRTADQGDLYERRIAPRQTGIADDSSMEPAALLACFNPPLLPLLYALMSFL
jgi:hypothetical protein